MLISGKLDSGIRDSVASDQMTAVLEKPYTGKGLFAAIEAWLTPQEAAHEE